MDSDVNQFNSLWISNDSPFPRDSSICREFLEIALQRPNAVAVEAGHAGQPEFERVTYGELRLKARKLAAALLARGVRPGDHVGLVTHRNADVVTGMLGILEAGAAYVPLDPCYPHSRLEFVVRDAGIRMVVTSRGMNVAIPGPDLTFAEIDDAVEPPEDTQFPTVAPTDTAYLIYTSGSTGRPKGVITPHRAVLRLTRGADYASFGPDRRFLQLASVSFDAATFEIWGALLNGGTCVIYPGEGLPDLALLRSVLESSAINSLWLTSSLFNSIVDNDLDMLAGPDEILVGGEALSVRHIRRALDRIPATLINGYGPTETTTFACTYRIPRDFPGDRADVPIGFPIGNTSISIRDADGGAVNQGEVGELFIGGPGLADGYLNRPELTAERFVDQPDAPGGRAYRTGDLVRVLPDGAIAFVGRGDGQVKISGHRIELSEIEFALMSHPGIKNAAAGVHASKGNPDRIAAWIVLVDTGHPASVTELRDFMADLLPAYMCPAIFTTLEALPLTASGKLDRTGLTVPVRQRPALEQAFAKPRGDLEEYIAAIWAELIGIDRVGRNDRFFELGGTSLMAMRFLEMLHRERGVRIGVGAFFDGPTVENLARLAKDGPQAPASLPDVRTRKTARSDRIAVIGLAGRFAGAPDKNRFWDMLVEGGSGRVEVTREDLLAAGEDPELLNDPDYVAAAYPVEDVEGFDARFFGMSPREVQIMDPQQRIFLEVAWSVLEDAGYDPRGAAERIGVFGGVGRNAYLMNNLMSHAPLRETAAEYSMLVGNERDFPCTHVAFRLGLRGPAINVQTACSTSGVAIHLAAESLRRNECDIALAGGAKILVPNRAGYHYTEGGPLSPDGFIRAFDADAGGMVRGSGAAMVALKRLDDAQKDGDHIYSVLIGSAVNNDGQQRAGFTAPSVSGQAEVIANAYQMAGVSANTISLIEAHGTGTPLGDPIELAALSRVFGQSGRGEGTCAIGSVKTNIGHLDAGATAAGVIKASLALKNGLVPPSLNFVSPNPKLDLEHSPFRVADTALEWKRGDSPRRAGISSFGLGGTNAHLVVEEAPLQTEPETVQGPELLVLSARSEKALARRCDDLADWLEKNSSVRLADVAHTLRVGRHRFETRLAFVCTDRADAIARLRARNPQDMLRTALAGDATPVTFMFPGGGAQYARMGQGLYETSPEFRKTVDVCDAHYAMRTGHSLVDVILGTAGDIEQPSRALPALFAVELAMARLWLSWGVEPANMIGHSMGEYTAACVAGVFTPEVALDIVLCRGRLFDTLAAGTMLSIQAPVEALTDHLTPELSVAAVNRPDQCVIAGTVEDIGDLAVRLAAEDIETRRVHINVAAHSMLVEPILEEFRAHFETISLHAPKRPFISNVTGEPIRDGEAMDPGYWVRHLRSTVRFSDGLTHVFQDPQMILLEAGPGQTLSSFARQHSGRGGDHEVLATIRHPKQTDADDVFLLSALGRAWRAGAVVDWKAFAGADARRVPLPTYPFERTRYWIDAVPFEPTAATAAVSPFAEADAAVAEAGYDADTHEEPASRFEWILAQIKQIIHQLSGLPMARIDEHATFLELGFDSLFLTQANAAFKKAFKLPLTTRQLMEATPRIHGLAEYIDGTLDADAVIGQAPAAVPVSGAPGRPAVLSTDGVAPQAGSPGVASVSKAETQGLSSAQEAHINELIVTTTGRTPKARASTQDSRAVLADPRTVQGFRSRWKEMVYPILSDRAKGSKVWDIDGNEYIDLVGGYGVTFLGHQPDFVVEAIKKQVDRTLAIGPQSTLAGEVAGLVNDLTGMERVAFCNTGSEAVLAAVRMARTVTGNSKIAKFDGHYHGIFDEMQVRGSGSGSRKVTLPGAPGIPAEAIQNTVILDYGNEDAFDVIRENADDLALVLVEPVRSRNPDFQPREYLQKLREVTRELGIPLMFDEIVTGFRSHPGGAQSIFGVRADIATYGKVAGGGLPIGIVAGSALFMDTLDGGFWRYGDGSVPMSDMTWFAGTFVRHPMALAATKATLEYLKKEGPALQDGLNRRAEKFADGLNAFFRHLRVPARMERFASVLRLTFTAHQEYADLLFFHLRNRGVMTYEGRPIFLTTAHSDVDLEKVHNAFVDSVREMIAAGLMDGRDPDAVRRIPMATGQQEIWVSAQFNEQASCSYNLCSTLRLGGRFDTGLFREAVQDLVERHEALRSVPERSGIMQVIHPVIEVPLKEEDLRGLPDGQRAERVEAAKQAEVRTPFDLLNGPLFRTAVLRLDDDDHLVLLTAHHVIADGWSCGVLCRELGKLYAARQRGVEPDLEPAQQLGDYVAMRNDPELYDTRMEARDYWLGLYPDGLPRLEFPSDRPRPKTRNYSANRLEVMLEQDLVSRLRKVAKEGGTTLFAALIGGFAAYVTRLTGVAENAIGFSAAGQPLLGGKSLVGHCVNFLPLKLHTDLSGGFDTHLRSIGGSILDALEHQNFDFVSFVQETRPKRDADWAPLVTVGVNLDPSAKAMEFADFAVEAGSVGRAFENLDMFLNFVETGSEVELQCTYNTALFDAATISRRMSEYLRFLNGASGNPSLDLGSVDLIAPRERAALVAPPAVGTGAYNREASVIDVFRDVVRRHPGNTALRMADAPDGEDAGVTSYADLDGITDGLARQIMEAGVAKGDRVAIVLPRSRELIAAILAVLKAGAVYVPVETSVPDERLRLVLKDSGARLVLGRADMERSWPDGGTAFLPLDDLAAIPPGGCADVEPPAGGDPAYIMYTSGSTGVPKGVVVPHRAISRLVVGNNFARLDETGTVACLAPPSFDASTFEIWAALLNGGTLAIIPGTGIPELATLKARLHGAGVTTLWLTAGLFNAVVDEDADALGNVREVLTGGEPLSVRHVKRAQQAVPGLQVVNGYGPTECTTFTCCYCIPEDFDEGAASVPIGRAIANTVVHIVDGEGRLLPDGVPGELVVGGDGLALGYWNREDLTRAAFRPDTVTPDISGPEARLYRTGDICRRGRDGLIEFLHRSDDQVKIRGFRIEPGEIEAVLTDLDGIVSAAVVAVGGAGDGRLVAFLVGGEGAGSIADIVSALGQKLPRHLVPSQIRFVDSIPITANGKVDRNALSRLVDAAPAAAEPETPETPETPTEHELIGMWTDILRKPVHSTDQSFFDLGGHSLSALRLFDRIHQSFGVDMPMSKLFSHPTVRELAKLVEEHIAALSNDGEASISRDDPWDTTALIHPGPGGDEAPMFIVGGLGGNVNHLFELGNALGRYRPVVGFQARGIMGHAPHDSIEAMAADNIRYMRQRKVAGPYTLAGYSAGAFVAFEMARQLVDSGQEVQELVLLDTYAPGFAEKIGLGPASANLLKLEVWDRIASEIPQMVGPGRKYFFQRLEGLVVQKLTRGPVLRWMARMSPGFARIRMTTDAWFAAANRYRTGPYHGHASLILSTSPVARERRIGVEHPDLGWSEYIDAPRLKTVRMKSNHLDLVKGDQAVEVADFIEARIQAGGASG